MIKTRTLSLVVLASLLLGACDDGLDVPEGTPEEVGRFVDGLIRYRENDYADQAGTAPPAQPVSALARRASTVPSCKIQPSTTAGRS